ncbi:hypothetical protein SKAU_G00293560 [Synaphobranchus kaupii]|uniref:Transmembrane protein 205 n=1 Tax=Synaphobranchus kaupii TaxID=118154 RepID=A0A9Q1IMI9_SYNKA|nr:hypothetical protein SKAU_G00293560 [Synaphobranchus kaupii]
MLAYKVLASSFEASSWNLVTQWLLRYHGYGRRTYGFCEGAALAGDVLYLGYTGVGLLHSRACPGVSGAEAHLRLVYHPRELLDWHETVQMCLYFAAVVLTGLNAQWFGPAIVEAMLGMHEVEREHGLGGEVRKHSKKEAYDKLREQDPKYKASTASFFRYHGLSVLCNLLAVICSTVNLAYTGLHLHTI